MAAARNITDLPYRPCVGIALANRDGRLFFGRRMGSDDSWQMPQGGIDPGETPAAAARRELQEETGISKAEILAESAHWYRYELPPAVAGRALRGRYRGQEQRWFLLLFTGTEKDIDLRTHHQEFSAWRWAEPAEVLARIVDFKRPVYEQVLAEFAPHLAALARK
jgi:putative (di)nucleoside polyphosphate hydrolase